MKRILIGIAMLAVAACTNPKIDGTEGLSAANVAFEAAFNSGDAAALAVLYTTDAAVMAPDTARIDGRQGIRDLWQSFFDARITDIDLVTQEIDIQAGRTSEVGTFTLSAPNSEGGRETLKGKYIVLWRQGADGIWRLHRDIWNSDPAG